MLSTVLASGLAKRRRLDDVPSGRHIICLRAPLRSIPLRCGGRMHLDLKEQITGTMLFLMRHQMQMVLSHVSFSGRKIKAGKAAGESAENWQATALAGCSPIS